MPAMGSAALSAALGQRAASTQSSVDVVTADNLAAALPELAQSITETAARAGGSLAPPANGAGKPPAFPQVGSCDSGNPHGTASRSALPR